MTSIDPPSIDHTAAAARELAAPEIALVEQARAVADELYRGERVPHHSCGAALAVTFQLSARPYQSLRRGGITGRAILRFDSCGRIGAGRTAGRPSPTGTVTETLRSALGWYQEQIPLRFDRGKSPDYVCNNLTRPLGDFFGPARKQFCTSLTAEVAALTAETVLRFAPNMTLAVHSLELDHGDR